MGLEGQGEGDNMDPKSREDNDMMQQILGVTAGRDIFPELLLLG